MPEVRPIDGNALVSELIRNFAYQFPLFDGSRYNAKDYLIKREDAVAFILNTPTLDAVPVVRCRECKHYREHERCSMSAVYRHCALHKGLAMVTPDSFCSYGERKEDAPCG